MAQGDERKVPAEIAQTIGAKPMLGGFAIEGPRVDIAPDLFCVRDARVLYRLDVTEAQLLYLYALVDIDEGENASMSDKELDVLRDVLAYHKGGIDGPSDDSDDRPPPADNE